MITILVREGRYGIFFYAPSSQPNSDSAANNNAEPSSSEEKIQTETPKSEQEMQSEQNETQPALYSQDIGAKNVTTPEPSAAVPEANNILKSQDEFDENSGEMNSVDLPDTAAITNSDVAARDSYSSGGRGGGSAASSEDGALSDVSSTSDATHKKSSDGSLSVSADNFVNAKNLAMHYGSYEDGIFGMTAENLMNFCRLWTKPGLIILFHLHHQEQ